MTPRAGRTLKIIGALLAHKFANSNRHRPYARALTPSCAQAATDASLNAELLTYSRAKGLFAGIDLSGASISQNTDDTKTLYGGNSLGYDKILHGEVPVPTAAQPFVRTVAKYFTRAKANQAAEKK